MSNWDTLTTALLERLKQTMQRAGVGQSGLAAATGTTQSTVNGILSRRHPNFLFATLVRMATGLRHDVGVVFIPMGQPYQWCGGQDCAGRHHFWYEPAPDVRLWCHGAPIR